MCFMVQKTILGLVEEVVLFGPQGKKAKVLARIDTGATSSSLDSALAKKLELHSSTKTKTIRSASGTKKRPMVTVTIQLRQNTLNQEFTLVDRAHMTYPVLIGQNILTKGKYLIDPLLPL